jgi:putative SOS response-associated peptidase YedK
MCGRFTLARSPEDVARAFGLDEVPNFPPQQYCPFAACGDACAQQKYGKDILNWLRLLSV